MDPEYLPSMVAQADFDEQSAFAEQVWTMSDDGTVAIQATAGAEPVVVNIEREEDEGEEDDDEPGCSASSTSSLIPSSPHQAVLIPSYQGSPVVVSAEASGAGDSSAGEALSYVRVEARSRHGATPSRRFHPYRRRSSRTRSNSHEASSSAHNVEEPEND
ncbi:hypothetical protein PMAYCL1PPCAC_10238 [Pristionchus mayeri]|uniref:Uncharacterized protein n=1 Tax=Pristionchus mayeri TaxID=1317129 RepID=A0AAN4ZF21_9BILA|nr:hypothetical protein PMAYCL1PPCAC_10238 [Pristionchus mayeri]